MPRDPYDEINIDKYKLHEEVSLNGERVVFWGDRFVEAEKQKKKVAKLVGEIRAELELKIRKNPEEFDIPGKPTESAVNSAVILQEEFQKAQEHLIDVEAMVKRYKIISDTFFQRKDLIKEEIKLFLGEYYTSSEIELSSQEIEEAVKAKRKAKSQSIY
jgi:hypothetical protein